MEDWSKRGQVGVRERDGGREGGREGERGQIGLEREDRRGQRERG